MNLHTSLFNIRRFDARRECDLRKYSYLLPSEIIGIGDHMSAVEIEDQLSDMNNILNMFEVCFLLYTIFCCISHLLAPNHSSLIFFFFRTDHKSRLISNEFYF